MSGKFHNTIQIAGVDLDRAIKKVEGQNDRIYQILKMSGKSLTPFEVHKVYQLAFNFVPITSIRRGMSDLTRDGKLEKLNEKRMGGYGMENFCWRAV